MLGHAARPVADHLAQPVTDPERLVVGAGPADLAAAVATAIHEAPGEWDDQTLI